MSEKNKTAESILTICGISPSDGRYEVTLSEVAGIIGRELGTAVAVEIETIAVLIEEADFDAPTLRLLAAVIRKRSASHQANINKIERRAIEGVGCSCPPLCDVTIPGGAGDTSLGSHSVIPTPPFKEMTVEIGGKCNVCKALAALPTKVSQ